MKETKRYQKLSRYPGIRKDNTTGRYYVTKSIKGKRYYKSFERLSEAIHWKNSFHPSIKDVDYRGQSLDWPFTKKVTDVPMNGTDGDITFADCWRLYMAQHLPSLEGSTRETKMQRALFFDGLMNYRMCEMTAILLDRYLEAKKRQALKDKRSKRSSFDADLKALRAVFNWYIENYDNYYHNPVRRRHFVMGRIKEKVYRDKKLNREELKLFLANIDGMWKEIAEAQFFLGARIQEVAGLITDSVNFDENYILIKWAVVWDRRSKKFSYLKAFPKNGKEKMCFMNQRLAEIMKGRFAKLKKGKFLFHLDGEPLSYRQIQQHYNEALKKAGLYGKFSGTHIMRHTMAQMANLTSTSGLNAVKAITGHLDDSMAQHYGGLPALESTKRVIENVEQYLAK